VNESEAKKWVPFISSSQLLLDGCMTCWYSDGFA
jgi:hypothetical protein